MRLSGHTMACSGSGENFDPTFGLMHTIEKSAEILIKVLSMKPDKPSDDYARQFPGSGRGLPFTASGKIPFMKKRRVTVAGRLSRS